MSNATDGLPPLLTETEVARLLRIDRSTLARLARAGRAPIEPIKVSDGNRRYRTADLQRLFDGFDAKRTQS
jgi:DNA-binding transcriptional MerR regulator